MLVLDLSRDVAGRFAAKLFGWAGERVVRIAPELVEPESLTVYLDSGKERADTAALPGLLAQCDLVFTSFDRGRHQGLAEGLAIPESCIQVTTSSYGATGPYAAWRGGSLADWAAGGYLYITGEPHREPLSGPENTCAYAAGYTAAAGAEAALIGRKLAGEEGGKGRHLDISTMESMLLLHQSTFARTQAGDLRRRTGRYTEVYPLTVLPCRTGHVSLGVVSDAEFDKMAIAMGHPEWSLDPRFVPREARWDNRDAMDAALSGFLLRHDADEVVAILQAGGVACAKVAGARDIADNPQLAHRGYWERVPGGGVSPGYPLRVFGAFEGAPGKPLPFRGGVGVGPVLRTDPIARTTDPAPNPSPEGEGLRNLPLAGIKVLDFTIFWAGPSAARTLADLGAEVVWVEQPGSREDTEIAPGSQASPFDFMQHLYATKMYRGKRSIHLDLTRPEDRKVAHALARDADIVLENYRPGVAGKLGVGPEELARINPGLVYVSLSGWGASGPWAEWRSYGPTIEAASSIEGRTGYAGGDPLRLGHAFPDATGGLAGALAALRGLRQRCEGAPGGWFDVSQLEVYTALAGEGILEATRHGRGIALAGNRSRFGAVQGVFPCRGEDQWIAIRLDGTDDVARFAAASQTDPAAFADPDRAEPAMAAFTRPWDKHDLAARLQALGLEAFPALDANELLADPHLAARGYFLDVAVGDRVCKVPGTPLVATPAMADPRFPAPRPGEHSDRIRKTIEAWTP